MRCFDINHYAYFFYRFALLLTVLCCLFLIVYALILIVMCCSCPLLFYRYALVLIVMLFTSTWFSCVVLIPQAAFYLHYFAIL